MVFHHTNRKVTKTQGNLKVIVLKYWWGFFKQRLILNVKNEPYLQL